jgi:hypothetical protein
MPKGKILMGKKTPKPVPGKPKPEETLKKRIPADTIKQGKRKPVMPRRGGK